MADRPITYREALSSALREEMQRDERVFIMGEEVGVWGGTYAVTRGFLDEFGDRRVRDTPISRWSSLARRSARPWPVCARSPRS